MFGVVTSRSGDRQTRRRTWAQVVIAGSGRKVGHREMTASSLLFLPETPWDYRVGPRLPLGELSIPRNSLELTARVWLLFELTYSRAIRCEVAFNASWLANRINVADQSETVCFSDFCLVLCYWLWRLTIIFKQMISSYLTSFFFFLFFSYLPESVLLY